MTSAAIKRGEVWWVSLDPTQGSEIKKTRPCLVLSTNILNRLRKTMEIKIMESKIVKGLFLCGEVLEYPGKDWRL
ncbi:MAG: type II toxin-antitoxin system PemK/MazF family toxin [Deltaproteobacteria bacterium]|nr:type II toxin-antitoxin system PemK/MazF family toxin [Deltaproteobacteria bacterium]